jgi:hypothetical protein
MKKSLIPVLLVFMISLAAVGCLAAPGPTGTRPAADVLTVSGTITNSQGKPVNEVALTFFANGEKVETN